MKLIDKYILKEVTAATAFWLLIFIVIWVSPEIMFKIIRQAVEGHITILTAFKLFFLELPEILGKAIPVGLMLGSLSVFDRLSKDSELTIFRGIGVSFIKIAMPVLFLSIIGTVLCYLTYEYLIPDSSVAIRAIKHDVNSGHFVYMDKTKKGKPLQVIIIENFTENNLSGITLLNFSKTVSQDVPLIRNIITSNNGVLQNNNLFIKEGLEYKIAANGVYNGVEPIKDQYTLSPEIGNKVQKLLTYSSRKNKEMKVPELRNYISLLNSLDMKDEARYVINKLHQRFAQPFSCVLLALCGVILGFSKPREQKFLGYTIGVGLIFLYYIIVPFLNMLAQTGIVNPVITAWTPNLLITSAMFVLIKYKQI